MIRRLDDNVWVCGQVAPHEVAGLAEQGVTVLVNNRPDAEEPDQPLAGDIEEAAAAAGIHYCYVPIRIGIGPADVAAMQDAVDTAAGGTILAFCRSGTRSALVLSLAKRRQGASAEEVQRALIDAGFDPAPISHLL